MSSDKDNCPSCFKKLNYFTSTKIETGSGKRRVNVCPKCDNYFEPSFKTGLMWFFLAMLPMFSVIIIPDAFESIKIWVFFVLALLVVLLAFLQERKRKRVIKEHGYWVLVNKR